MLPLTALPNANALPLNYFLYCLSSDFLLFSKEESSLVNQASLYFALATFFQSHLSSTEKISHYKMSCISFVP
jgi:hypothetical protein